VTGAKIVTSTKQPGSKCFGLVTLSSSAEVDECIKQVNGREVGGNVITVEKVSTQLFG